ncbi:MAG: hypothetical protein ACK2T0_14530, partial [Anaerolineales bacterium]
PFPMAVQTLTVVSAFQSGLGKIIGAGCAVTFPTREYLVRGVEMVAQGATTRHLGHLGVELVGEYDRHILRGKLIHQNHVRALGGSRAWT